MLAPNTTPCPTPFRLSHNLLSLIRLSPWTLTEQHLSHYMLSAFCLPLCVSKYCLFHYITTCLVACYPGLTASLPHCLNISFLSPDLLYYSTHLLYVSLSTSCLTEACLSHLSLWNLPADLQTNTFSTQHRPSRRTPPVLPNSVLKKSTHNWDEFSRHPEWHFIYFIFTRFNYALRSGGKWWRDEEYEGGKEIECKPKVARPQGTLEERALIADAR